MTNIRKYTEVNNCMNVTFWEVLLDSNADMSGNKDVGGEGTKGSRNRKNKVPI